LQNTFLIATYKLFHYDIHLSVNPSLMETCAVCLSSFIYSQNWCKIEPTHPKIEYE